MASSSRADAAAQGVSDACRERKKIDLLNSSFLCNNSFPESLRAGARAVTVRTSIQSGESHG
jgi:hypothetical protein